MSPQLEIDQFPELIIGIAGPIGVDIDAITSSIGSALSEVGYQSSEIKLTSAMLNFRSEILPYGGTDFFQIMTNKMDYADSLRKNYGDPAVLAMIAVREIQRSRRGINHKLGLAPENQAASTAYVVRQFKTPDEVNFLRRLYGKQFILVSSYGSEQERRRRIEARIRMGLPRATEDDEIAKRVQKLISRDQSEDSHEFGQQLRDTFHMADVFVDGINRSEMDRKIGRFTRALFGRNDISPSKEEYGMYTAKSAALRSADLSRQVGAAIISDEGEVVSQGCNEVPRAFGGTYWDSEEPDFRDIQLRLDPNDLHKKGIIRDILERLEGNGLLSDKAKSLGSSWKQVDALLETKSDHGGNGALVGSEIMDLTEYGRVVHAEMCAICEAARVGRGIRGTTLYCTTFPCHNCTKHILMVGIKKVVYMEPYPKSKAQQLPANEISLEVEIPGRVSFVPFLGISPLRYQDIFEKRRRKKRDGSAETWYGGAPRPQIDILQAPTPEMEALAYASLFGSFGEAREVAETSNEGEVG